MSTADTPHKEAPGSVDIHSQDESDRASPDSQEDTPAPIPRSQLPLGQIPPGSLPASVKKNRLHFGRPMENVPPYPEKTRLRFHFQASGLDDGKVYDDTHNHPKPMELIIGKKFKIEIWELALHTMTEGEVARFIVPKQYCIYYPMVAKVLRESINPCKTAHNTRSCCGSLVNGLGFPDLDELVRSPQGMAFVFEILEVNLPGQYDPESWYMTDEEKLTSLDSLRDAGNKLFKERHYKEASIKYIDGVNRIDQLMNREAPGSKEQKELEQKKIPFLLNYAFCKQNNREYYEAVRFNTMVLDISKANVKALFRRGQCNKFLGNFEDARQDLRAALELDSTLNKAVADELHEVNVQEKGSVEAEKIRYQKMFSK